MCVYVRPVVLDSPGARVTGNCRLPEVGAGNQTQVLLKQSTLLPPSCLCSLRTSSKRATLQEYALPLPAAIT